MVSEALGVLRLVSIVLATSLAGAHHVVRYGPTTPADIFIVAHEDDWQLFMGNVAAERARDGHRLIFVYLTAGDNGRDTTYWRTRERAALAAQAALAPGATDSTSAQCDTMQINSHRLTRCTLPNSVAWFLRLPDGRRNGSGFQVHNSQSLRKLRTRQISAISAIDGSTSYESWSALVATVTAIAKIESPMIASVHTHDPNVVINPHDHFDHRMAGRLSQSLERSEQWNALYYLGYALAARDDNLRPSGVQAKSHLFQEYDRVMVAVNPKWSALAEHRVFYLECLRRTYWRRSSKGITRRTAVR